MTIFSPSLDERTFTSNAGGSGGSSTYAYSDWASSTPTFNNLGTTSEVTFYQKRQGSDLLLRGKFKVGTVGATTASLILPGGLELALSKISEANLNWLGEGQKIRQGATSRTTSDRFILFSDQSSTTNIFFALSTGSNTLIKANGSAIFVANDYCVINLRCPISGW